MLMIFNNEFAKRKQVSLRGMCRILVSEEVKEGLKQWCKPVLRVCKKIVSIFQDVILGEQRIGFGCWNRGEVIYIHFPL